MNITQAPRNQVKRNHTLKADPDQSLFKFQLKWANTGVDNPKTFYSIDKSEERTMFYQGIKKELRLRWLKLLQQLPNDCFQFFASCYPEQLNEIDSVEVMAVKVFYTAYPQNVELRERLKLKYGELRTISKLMKDNGLQLNDLRGVDMSSTPKPSDSPKYHKDIATFNGVTAVKRWFQNPNNKFFERGLLEVIIYDNLCYHPDNQIGVWTRADLFPLQP